MYNVTLHRLDSEVRSASPDYRDCALGGVSGEELTSLLERFCQLDAVENAHADPEIRMEKGRQCYIVKTGQKKLFLYNVRDRLAPTSVVTPAEVLVELDAIARPAASFAKPTLPEVPDYIPPAPPPPRSRRRLAVLAILGLLLAAAFVFLNRPAEPEADAGPPLSSLEPAELAAARRTVVGVFMTGNAPGQHGIALTEEGAAKLFRLNERAAPSIVLDTFKLARRGTALVALVEGLGTVIEVTGADTLVYCGETYRRIP